MQEDLKKLMLILVNDVIKRGSLAIRTPKGCQEGDLVFGLDSCLEKLVIACVSCSDDVTVIAADTALDE